MLGATLQTAYKSAFQYKACVGLITAFDITFNFLSAFQYKACVGLIKLRDDGNGKIIGFQYKACVGLIISAKNKTDRIS